MNNDTNDTTTPHHMVGKANARRTDETSEAVLHIRVTAREKRYWLQDAKATQAGKLSNYVRLRLPVVPDNFE